MFGNVIWQQQKTNTLLKERRTRMKARFVAHTTAWNLVQISEIRTDQGASN